MPEAPGLHAEAVQELIRLREEKLHQIGHFDSSQATAALLSIPLSRLPRTSLPDAAERSLNPNHQIPSPIAREAPSTYKLVD